MGMHSAIIVVNYGSSELLGTNLVATANAAGHARVYVVDNASTARERTAVQALCDAHGWTCIGMDANVGFGTGVNAGVARALADGATDMLVLNPDARIDEDSLAALAAATREDRLLLVSPVIRTPDGRTWFDGSDLYLHDGATRGIRRRDEFAGRDRVPWLTGACLWITREVWELTGGFADEFFLYWEDVDLSWRLRERGGRIAVVADAVAWHDEGATHREESQRSEAKSVVYYTYNIRNRMLFAARNLDDEGIRRWLRSSPASARAILLRGGRRQFLRPIPPLRAAWRGLRDGRRIAREELARRRADTTTESGTRA